MAAEALPPSAAVLPPTINPCEPSQNVDKAFLSPDFSEGPGSIKVRLQNPVPINIDVAPWSALGLS
jgi:hypothetical protein